MNTLATRGLLAAAAVALAPLSANAWSPKLEVNPNTWVQLGYLHQFWFESVADKNAGSRSEDFFTRRNRVMLLGQAAEKVHFFLNYDAPGSGPTEGASSPVLTDAMIDYRISKEFSIVVGRQLVPFSVANQNSAVTLLGMDYPTRALANQPTVAGSAFWRDDGVSVRGLLADGKIDYRVGYFRGDRNNGTDRNPGGDGRITGMVMINLAQSQGWFFNPNSLGSLDVLSFGVGFDQIGRSGGVDHKAFSVFGIAEKKVGDGHLSANFAFYDWDGVVGGFGNGKSSVVQLGYLMTGSKWQPTFAWQQQNPDAGPTLNTYNLGLAYYISGHRANVKFEYAIDDQFIGGEKKDAFRIQTQLFF